MLPTGGIVPLQPPEAVQALAYEEFHCSVTAAPIATLLSLAFRLTNGGGTTAGVVMPVDVDVGAVEAPSAEDVCAFELAPHAASKQRAVNPSVDFNANANLVRRLRRIELIRRLPRFPVTTCSRSANLFIRNL